jgi:hypothetical protein
VEEEPLHDILHFSTLVFGVLLSVAFLCLTAYVCVVTNKKLAQRKDLVSKYKSDDVEAQNGKLHHAWEPKPPKENHEVPLPPASPPARPLPGAEPASPVTSVHVIEAK